MRILLLAILIGIAGFSFGQNMSKKDTAIAIGYSSDYYEEDISDIMWQLYIQGLEKIRHDDIVRWRFAHARKLKKFIRHERRKSYI